MDCTKTNLECDDHTVIIRTIYASYGTMLRIWSKNKAETEIDFLT